MNAEVAQIARIVTGGVFVIVGVRNAVNHASLADFMKLRRVPAPRLSAWIGTATQIILGALLAAGLWPLTATIGLAIFVVMATVIAHGPFDKSGADRTDNITACLVNALVLGGLLAHLALSL
jgi:putative oxidoreductase